MEREGTPSLRCSKPILPRLDDIKDTSELDRLIAQVHKGKKVEAEAIFDAAALPDTSDQSVGMLAQGVYFTEDLDIDRSMLVPGDDPEDYLIPQAPEFFAAAGEQRTLEIMNGAEESSGAHVTPT